MSGKCIVISGIPAGDSGTGRFIAHLESHMYHIMGDNINLITRPERPATWRIKMLLESRAYKTLNIEVLTYIFLACKFWFNVVLVMLKPTDKLLLLHPQNLGYDLALRLLQSRKTTSLIYLLDSSFFCIASYNHITNENSACLRCITIGFDQRHKKGCKPFPRSDNHAMKFAPRLRQLVHSGLVKVAAQNVRQAELAKEHFGMDSTPPVVGLWTQDWDQVFLENKDPKVNLSDGFYTWDILFHGHALDAKGASWLIKLAGYCPELRFMFPFSKPDTIKVTSNCYFVSCTWEDGLQQEIKKSKYVAVPSLWSAPIEGSLVKSIVCSRAVVVIDNGSSFCDELPEGLVLKLPETLPEASIIMRKAIDENWLPDLDIKSDWIKNFAKHRLSFVKSLLTLLSKS